MKDFFKALGVYFVSLAIAVFTAFWVGTIFFSDVKYIAGALLISRDLGYSIYGILISYPFFITIGLIGFLTHHRVWWTIGALIPLLVFELAFGPELIGYSAVAAIIGLALGYGISRLFRAR